MIVSGIDLFGDNPFGWRFFPVIFGTISIVLFYLISRQLGMSERASFLATFLLAFENLSFVQAGVAMLDVFSLTFMLASFYFYLKGRYVASGISVGLAALMKLSGALALVVILLRWLFAGRKRSPQFLASMLAAPASFLLLLPAFDFPIWHRLVSPFAEISKMLHATIMATFARYPSEMLSRPWQWVLEPKIITYWINPHYIGMISPTVWALIIPAVIYMGFKAIKGKDAAIFALAWFAGTYLFWIPADLVTDRISYVYYFYPAIGAICIGVAMGFSQISGMEGSGTQNPSLSPSDFASSYGIFDFAKGRGRRVLSELLIPLYLLLSLGAFVILAPLSYWWKVPIAVIAYAGARIELRKSIPGPSFAKGREFGLKLL